MHKKYKQPPLTTLKDNEKEQLTAIIENPSSQEIAVLRARALLEKAKGKKTSQIAAELGISESTISRWHGRYLKNSFSGLTKKRKLPHPINLNPEEKLRLRQIIDDPSSSKNIIFQAKAILDCEEGKTYQQISEELGIGISTVNYWRNRFFKERLNGIYERPKKRPPSNLTPDEDEYLKRVIKDPNSQKSKVLKAKAILEYNKGKTPADIAQELSRDNGSIYRWVDKFLIERLKSLEDKPKTPRGKNLSSP